MAGPDKPYDWSILPTPVDNFGIFGPEGKPISPWQDRENFAPKPPLSQVLGTTPVPPAAPETPVAPMQNAGGGIDASAINEEMEGISSVNATNRYLLGLGEPRPQAPSAYWRPAAEDYSSIGGERGKSDFDSAFVSGPQEQRALQAEMGKLEGERTKAVSQFYDQQAERDTAAVAAARHQREQDAAAIEQRQQNLDRATQFYTDDLADQGKFWTNPGNIISAIAYSLLPAFGGDPTAGARLINQAVQQDMSNRQHAAASTLGALKSNLDGYHKIAGDRQAGEMLAQAEAHRMAANEVRRIGMKFESPISQKRVEILAKDQEMKSAALRMEAFRAWVNQPVRKMDPAEHAARGQGYDGAFRAYGAQGPQPGVQANKTVAGAVKGNVAGSPSTASNASLSPTYKAIVKAGGGQAALKAVIEGRVTGMGDVAEALKMSLEQEAFEKAGRRGPDAVFAEKQRILQDAQKVVSSSPELVKLAPRRVGIGRLWGRIDQIEQSELAAGKDPNQFLKSARSYMPTAWVDRYEAFEKQNRGPVTPGSAAESAALAKDAKLLLRQQLAQQINGYIRETSGGAVSTTEDTRLSRVISPDMTFDQMKAWVDNESRSVNAEESAVLKRLSSTNPIAGLLYRVNAGTGKSYVAPTADGVPRPRPDGKSGQYVRNPNFIGPPK